MEMKLDELNTIKISGVEYLIIFTGLKTNAMKIGQDNFLIERLKRIDSLLSFDLILTDCVFRGRECILTNKKAFDIITNNVDMHKNLIKTNFEYISEGVHKHKSFSFFENIEIRFIEDLQLAYDEV